MTNNTITARIARYIALPVVSAGIIGGAALGMAGLANAADRARWPRLPVQPDHHRRPRPYGAAGLAQPPWREPRRDPGARLHPLTTTTH